MKKIARTLIVILSLVVIGLYLGTPTAAGIGTTIYASAEEGTPTATATPTATPTATATPTPTTVITATPTPVPDAVLSAVYAFYTGSYVLVGEKVDKSKIVATAFYSDGSSVRLEAYELTNDVIQSVGDNKVILTYGGMIATFNVIGRKIVGINAVTSRYTLSLGNMLDSRDISVSGQLDDYSVIQIKSGFTVSPAAFTATGSQKVTIEYQGLTTEVSAYVRDSGSVVSITASYEGKEVIAGTEIDRDKITVNAIFSDYTTERITTYTLVNKSFETTGEQTVTIEFGGKTTTVKVKVVARTAVSMRAEYDGQPVRVGKEFKVSDLHVYVLFNDEKEREVTDYSVHTYKIRYVGENEVKIYYDDLQTSVVILGTQVNEPSFDYVAQMNIQCGQFEAEIEIAIPDYLEQDCIYTKSYKQILFKKAYKKLKCTEESEYIPFSFNFKNDDDEVELPLAVRITIPEGYDIAFTDLYYTPNRKTIVGKMTKTKISDNVFEVTIYKSGSYMLVYNPYEEEEYEVEW